MKSIFEQVGGTYRREGDYLIPNLALPDTGGNQIGIYGRMRRRYLKEHRRMLYTNLLTSGNLRCYLAEIDQACKKHRICYGKAGRRNRSAESGRSDGVGAPYEQYSQPCRGNCTDGTCIRLIECPLSAVWLITGILFILLEL